MHRTINPGTQGYHVAADGTWVRNGKQPMNKTTIQQPVADAEAQRIAALRRTAHAAADAAEKAWYELAGAIDVGPDRARAFEVYENLRHARRVG